MFSDTGAGGEQCNTFGPDDATVMSCIFQELRVTRKSAKDVAGVNNVIEWSVNDLKERSVKGL